MKTRSTLKLAVAVSAGIVPALLMAGPARAGLSPATGTLTIKAGASGTENKTVTVPAKPATADIEIAIDTTGSMGPAIAQAKSSATDLVNQVKASIPDARFSVVDFKDDGDGANEYVVRAPLTADASTVQGAINAMSANSGGDAPEAYNVVFHDAASPVTGGDLGWRDGSRKFVVVIGDASPHNATGYADCDHTRVDPHGLDTATELSGLAAAQRTLLMIAAAPEIKPCYDELVAGGFSGSTAVNLGTSVAGQVVDLINAATSQVSDVHLAVASASPAPAAASWISFDPSAVGPVNTPATLPFTLTAHVPTGTPAGSYTFDIVALADGADIGHQTLTIVVPSPVTMSGRAYGVYAGGLVHVSPTPDTGDVLTPDASTHDAGCLATVKANVGLAKLTSANVCAKVQTFTGPNSSKATATVDSTHIDAIGLGLLSATPVIDVKALKVTSATDCSSTGGDVTIASLKIGTLVLTNVHAKANTTLNVGPVSVVVDEQTAIPGGTKVNGLHIKAAGLLDVVLASAESDIHGC